MSTTPDGEPEASPADVFPAPEARWHYRRSLASRVTLLTTIAVGIAVAVLSAGVYITARIQLQSQLDDSLEDRAHATAKEFRYSGNISLPKYLANASDVQLYRIAAGEGGTGPPLNETDLPLEADDPEIAVAAGELDLSVRTLVVNGEERRVVAVPIVDGEALVIAESLDDQREVLARLGGVSLLFGLLGVLGAGIAGWGVARNGLRPVRRLTTAVEQIARTEELDPLPVEGADEVARLATAFNGMLASLSASRDRQRRLVTDAGHELRTPLTSLRTNVDLLTQADHDQKAIDPQARVELLDDIRAQIDELTTLIGDLTELARDEPLAPVVGEIDLSEVVEMAAARVRRRAIDVTFDVVTDRWFVVGEAGSLERAVTNLLDNAAKWSPSGGRVTVRLGAGDGVGVLTVDDQGPGIPEDQREKVFDRFWRTEESRSMPGSGLGLSIVRQVVERHSGSVTATESTSGGARLVLVLPGRPDA
ncbi:HAMP domain-containing sensor histidine kinase [Nocardioides dongxiaopingii]|uniref:HAMP domain-containing sensor histidine kinase n=1 Tax=Nocardioides TaxID=1839 RepID=UPI001FEB0F08|nr:MULTISPECIES: HAMP domain-containing sensor histidine kinase [Nocardioides]